MLNCIPLENGLDDLFGEGVRAGTITQIYGPPGSGKSNIAMHAVVSCVKKGKKAIFIDTEGSFNRKRIEQMAGESLGRVLENTYIFEPNSLAEQGEIINSLTERVEGDVSLIVVDSMVYYYRLEMDRENPNPSSKELGLQLAQLMQVARKKGVAVLITNQVYTNMEKGHVEPVGGDVMKYGSKIILQIDNGVERKARIVKHQFLKEGQEKEFRIVGRGII